MTSQHRRGRVFSMVSVGVAAGLALAACGGTTATTQTPAAVAAAGQPGTAGTAGTAGTSGAAATSGSTAASSPSGSVSAGTAAAAARPGEYVEYQAYSADPAAHQNTDVVLFFHAPWCPDCRATESSITKDGVPAGLTVVKVDFDSMTDLKQKYGITQQHTFVKVDAQGGLLGKWTGSFTGAAIKAKADAT
jgi:thioredoxin 1